MGNDFMNTITKKVLAFLFVFLAGIHTSNAYSSSEPLSLGDFCLQTVVGLCLLTSVTVFISSINTWVQKSIKKFFSDKKNEIRPAEIKIIDQKNEIKPTEVAITMDNYDGQKIPEVLALIDQIKNPEKYTKKNINLPKIIFFTGSPGCGKAYLVHCMVGTIGCPFFVTYASDFYPQQEGDAERIKQLFTSTGQYAKNHASKTAIILVRGRNNKVLLLMNRFRKMICPGNEGINVIIIVTDSYSTSMTPFSTFDHDNMCQNISVPNPSLQQRQKLIEYHLLQDEQKNESLKQALVYVTKEMSLKEINTFFTTAGSIALEKKKERVDEECFYVALFTIQDVKRIQQLASKQQRKEIFDNYVRHLVQKEEMMNYPKFIQHTEKMTENEIITMLIELAATPTIDEFKKKRKDVFVFNERKMTLEMIEKRSIEAKREKEKNKNKEQWDAVAKIYQISDMYNFNTIDLMRN